MCYKFLRHFFVKTFVIFQRVINHKVLKLQFKIFARLSWRLIKLIKKQLRRMKYIKLWTLFVLCLHKCKDEFLVIIDLASISCEMQDSQDYLKILLIFMFHFLVLTYEHFAKRSMQLQWWIIPGKILMHFQKIWKYLECLTPLNEHLTFTKT